MARLEPVLFFAWKSQELNQGLAAIAIELLIHDLTKKKGFKPPFQGELSKNSAECQAPSDEKAEPIQNPKSKIQNRLTARYRHKLLLFGIDRQNRLIPMRLRFTRTTAKISDFFPDTSLFSGILELDIQNFLF